jgi:segregation and condensation protein B
MDDDQNTTESDDSGLSLQAQVESLLFVATEPLPVERLAGLLEVEVEEVDQALLLLSHDYAGRGMRIQRKGKRVQMVTAPEAADIVRKLLGLELTGKLSPAALETLAMVAYRQPITRAEIETIRGVGSDSVLRTLINRGLIEETGRLDQAGRPIIYGTTFDFLQQFGITSLDQLPPLEEMEAQ